MRVACVEPEGDGPAGLVEGDVLGPDRPLAGALTLARGAAEAPDAMIEAEPGALAAVLWHGRDLREAERAGELAITGSRRVATRFLGRFPLAAHRP